MTWGPQLGEAQVPEQVHRTWPTARLKHTWSLTEAFEVLGLFVKTFSSLAYADIFALVNQMAHTCEMELANIWKCVDTWHQQIPGNGFHLPASRECSGTVDSACS